MGGVFRIAGNFFKAVTKVVTGKKKKKEKSVPEMAQTVTAAARTAQQRKASLGSGYGTSGQTIMTGTTGVEEQARTGKTLLGGG